MQISQLLCKALEHCPFSYWFIHQLISANIEKITVRFSRCLLCSLLYMSNCPESQLDQAMCQCQFQTCAGEHERLLHCSGGDPLSAPLTFKSLNFYTIPVSLFSFTSDG